MRAFPVLVAPAHLDAELPASARGRGPRARSRGFLGGARLRGGRQQPAETRDGNPDPVGAVIQLVPDLVHRLLDEMGIELDTPRVRVARQEGAPGGCVEVAPEVRRTDPRHPFVRVRFEQFVRAFLAADLPRAAASGIDVRAT